VLSSNHRGVSFWDPARPLVVASTGLFYKMQWPYVRILDIKIILKGRRPTRGSERNVKKTMNASVAVSPTAPCLGAPAFASAPLVGTIVFQGC
jgi:hypothetical protein